MDHKERQIKEILFDKSETAVTSVSVMGQVLDPNKAICELFHYSKEDFKRLTFDQITVAEYLPIDRRYFNQLVRGDIDNYHMVKGYITKSGLKFMADLYVYAVKGENDEVEEIIAKVIPHNKVNKRWFNLFASNSKLIASVIGTVILGALSILLHKLFGFDLLNSIP